MSNAVETLLTAEEYARLPDNGRLTELVRGKVVEVPVPFPNHGYYCVNISSTLREFVRAHDLGRVVSNDSGVITDRGPDTVRGPDVAYYSYARVPRGPLPEGYWPAPDLVFEVRSPSNRWVDINVKVGEYFKAGVLVVCVLDPSTETLTVWREDEFPRPLTVEEELTLPGILEGFRVTVRELLS